MDATWTDVDFEDTCDTFNRLYCFTVVPEPGSALLGLTALSALGVLARSRRSRS
jgi:MYXO-CTERM domain-containing protein